MTTSVQFDLRLVQYTPLGARIGPIPTTGDITFSNGPSGPTLNASVSTAIAGTLPTSLEVAVEWWRQTTQTWAEGRDSRFAVTQQSADDRDKSGIVTLTGIGLFSFLLQGAALAGVEPYVNTGAVSEVSKSSTTVSVSGSTFTWASHGMAEGDRVRITAPGSAKGITSGSVYYVRNPTSSTFQLSTSAKSTVLKNCGTASNVGMLRIVTRLTFGAPHSFNRSDCVSVVGGGTLGLTDGSQYYVVNPTSETLQLSSTPNGDAIEFQHGATNVTEVYRYLDGQRVFTNATPGTVMDAVFGEARDRGWGVNPADPSQTVTHGWTTTAGSDGVAWTKMADDPTTPGISIGFQPGTPGTQVLQALLDNQYAEWYTTQRIIHLVNHGTGTDWTTYTYPRRIGTTASSVKIDTDATSMRNAIQVRGTGPIIVEKDATPATGSWGRLETYETAQGATSKTLASAQAATDLAADQNPTVAYTVTEMAQEAAWLPLVSYARGDWVAVWLKASGWTRLRVVGWTFQKTAGGAITVTVNLENIKRTLLTKQAKAIVTTSAGLSTTSTPGSTLQEPDNRKAAAPLGLAVTSTGFFAKDNSAAATATVTWLPVVTDLAGQDIQAIEYDVWVRPDGAQFGQSVGKTQALSLDVSPLPSNAIFAVKVRAQSSDGTWGEFSDELDFTTAYPVVPPNTPTAPTLTTSLAGVRIRWDGNLLDSTGTPTAPDAGFAYVFAVRGTSAAAITGGTYTVVGTNLGNAGYTIDQGLTVGTTYYYALFAMNTVGNESPVSGIASVAVQGVQGPDIAANSVTANNILTGSITADKMNLGTIPLGSPADRVPMPPAQTAFWALALTGATTKVVYGNALNATSGSTGITLTSTAAAGVLGANCWATQQLPDVASSTIYLSGLTTAGLAQFVIREWSNVTTNTYGESAPQPITAKGFSWTLAATTVAYAVDIVIIGPGTDTVTSAHVFEAVGAGYSYEGATLQPDGLRIYSGQNPNPILALTSSSDDVLSLSSATGDQVATIDTAGNAGFATVNAGAGSAFDGVPLILDPSDPGFTDTLSESSPNGNGWTRGNVTLADGSAGIVALLDRLGRGVIYDVTWPSQNGSAVAGTIQAQRIAQDKFVLEDGRSYMIVAQMAGLAANNPGSNGLNLELQFNTVPNTSVNAGTTVNNSVIYNGNNGTWTLPPIVYVASAGVSAIDTVNRVLPAGVPIYWQVDVESANPEGVTVTWIERGASRGLTVIDVGSAYPTRPNTGYDALADTHDYTSNAATTSGTSSGTSATSKTVQANASWSRSWNGSGGSIVSGSGQWDNAKALYQGNGASAMGSEFGFTSTFLGQFAGKTITSAYIYLKNAYQAYSGHSALLSTTGDASAPGSISGRGANQFSKGFSAGQGQWVALSSAIRSGLSSGTVKAFRLGVSGSNSDYMYFEGVGYGSHPPQLKVTYY